MNRGAKRKRKSQSVEGASVRATIRFPSELYKTLEGIAREKKVSLAWVVREAGEQYIAEKWPLFGKNYTAATLLGIVLPHTGLG
jgi:predicted DNA-binding ribbon-helix-helix protein